MMRINIDEFFREATLKICSSLDVETFLYESFIYIQHALELPADYASIVYISPDQKKLSLLAIASKEGGMLHKDSVTIPENKKDLLKKRASVDDVMITDTLDQHPFAGLWVAKGYTNKTAQLSLRLDINGEIVGAVNFCSERGNKFTEEHSNLISILKEPFAIATSNAIRYQEISELKENLKEDNRFLQDELRQTIGEEIIGTHLGLKGVMEMVSQVAHLSSPVLLLGETGTGKELISSAIHNLSNRKENPFVKVNCGAIPENLIDSELFGYEKGAFTGAFTRKRGRFERANKGTLFLDEVGELKPNAQIRLLRVLQEKEIERVGGTEPVYVDIRIIAATHRNLSKLVKEGIFREDLFFRLNVFPVIIPPLRDRKADIIGLVHHFIQKKSFEMGLNEFPVIGPDATKQLMEYSWPGNVRELENAVERAIILNKKGPIHFPELQGFKDIETQSNQKINQEYTILENEKEVFSMDKILSDNIRKVLKITNGKIHGKNGAAELLEMNPSTLRNKMKKLNIPFGKKAS